MPLRFEGNQVTIWVPGWNRDTMTAPLPQPSSHTFHSTGLSTPFPTRMRITHLAPKTTPRHQTELSLLRPRLPVQFHPPQQTLLRQHPVESCHPTKSQFRLPYAEKTHPGKYPPQKRHEENGVRPIPASRGNGKNRLPALWSIARYAVRAERGLLSPIRPPGGSRFSWRSGIQLSTIHRNSGGRNHRIS